MQRIPPAAGRVRLAGDIRRKVYLFYAGLKYFFRSSRDLTDNGPRAKRGGVSVRRLATILGLLAEGMDPQGFATGEQCGQRPLALGHITRPAVDRVRQCSWPSKT
jgi:hypothetical protein